MKGTCQCHGASSVRWSDHRQSLLPHLFRTQTTGHSNTYTTGTPLSFVSILTITLPAFSLLRSDTFRRNDSANFACSIAKGTQTLRHRRRQQRHRVTTSEVGLICFFRGPLFSARHSVRLPNLWQTTKRNNILKPNLRENQNVASRFALCGLRLAVCCVGFCRLWVVTNVTTAVTSGWLHGQLARETVGRGSLWALMHARVFNVQR